MAKKITKRSDGVYELPRAREVRLVREAIEAMPEVRADKVEQLKRLLAEGLYAPDSRVAARNILKESALDQLSADDLD
ncbi:MAG: flagellar biosynthesis anti-sigma factor FlgM [Myxococcales bacterium]|nr:flagellar biosynthesis anti-sigma factor FlgM [Myxococcales bacterium]